jgi:hypothetical protein
MNSAGFHSSSIIPGITGKIIDRKLSKIAQTWCSRNMTFRSAFPDSLRYKQKMNRNHCTFRSKISTRPGGDPYGTFKNLTLDGWWTIVFLMMVFGLVTSLMAFLVSMLLNNRKTT